MIPIFPGIGSYAEADDFLGKVRLDAAAVGGAGRGDGGDLRPLPALADDRRDVRGLHPHRARQGPAGAAGDHAARRCAARSRRSSPCSGSTSPCCSPATRSSPRPSSTSPGSGAETFNAIERLRPADDPGDHPVRRLLHRHPEPGRRHRSTPTWTRGCATSERDRCSRSRTCGSTSTPTRASSRPSTASRSTVEPGRDARDRRRVGLRQERRQHDDPRAHAGAERRDLRADPVRGRDLDELDDEELRDDPRQRDLDDLPGPALVPAPVLQGRQAAGRGDPGAPGHRRRRGARARGRAARPGRDPRRRAAGRRVPARVLGRHAPAGDDRDGAHQRPEAADRRRADDRARRHHPGADPAADRAAAGRSSGWR